MVLQNSPTFCELPNLQITCCVIIFTAETLIQQKHIWVARDKIRRWYVGGKKLKVGKHAFFRVFNIINIHAANLMNEETKRKFLFMVSYLSFCIM